MVMETLNLKQKDPEIDSVAFDYITHCYYAVCKGDKDLFTLLIARPPREDITIATVLGETMDFHYGYKNKKGDNIRGVINRIKRKWQV